MARVPLDRPGRIVDVGCGPGNSTALLAARFPAAAITGLDTSPDMLKAAATRLPGAAFVNADIATWAPGTPFDLIFGNAVFQWVTDHLAVLERLLASCRSGGVLALQVPDNLGEPTHRLMAEVAEGGAWRERFKAPIARETIPPPAAYYDRLKPLSAAVDIWHTVYYHPLADTAAIVEWLKGTGLRPYLDRLDESGQAAFLAAYTERIAETHPPLSDGRVLLRFPRLFVVAVRS